MKTRRHIVLTIALLGIALITPPPASALILVVYGNKPVQNFGWPEGTLAVANLESRLGYWEGPPSGGGEYHFLYRGDNESVNVALKVFVAIHAEKTEVILHDGPGHDQFVGKGAPVDWSFTVWIPESWKNLYNNPKVTFNTNDPNYGKSLPPPRMDVYVGAGGLDWNKIAVPDNVHVSDQRAAAKESENSRSSPKTAIDSKQVEQCLKDFESITNGMTRAQVESKLNPDGGLRSASSATFVHPVCHYFKIKVEFDFKRDASNGNRAVENKNDCVVRVSKPYLERPFSD